MAKKTATRQDCFRMAGRLKAIKEVLAKDAKDPLPAMLSYIRSQSRAHVIGELVDEACELLESLAPQYDKQGN